MGKKSRRTRTKMPLSNLKRHTCPKCKQAYKPKYPNKKAAQAANEKTFIEQHQSGICSDKCWDACSEVELYNYKFFNPRYSNSCCKMICIASDTGKVFEKNNKNGLDGLG